MSWIKTIDEEQARGGLLQCYNAATRAGTVDDIIKVQSLDSGALLSHLNLYKSVVLESGPLSRARREMIGTVVSAANRCRYCMVHHGEALRKITENMRLVLALIVDYDAAPLQENDRAMIEYAVQLTEEPSSVVEEDIDRLREVGFSDKEVLSITQSVAYFNFVNRMASGLGVELERRWFEEGPWREIVDSALQRSSF